MDIVIADARPDKNKEYKKENATYVLGDEQVTPKPIDLISKKLNSLISKTDKLHISDISLTNFDLIIDWQSQASYGAAFAGTSYPLAILIEESASKYERNRKDGVISNIRLKINGIHRGYLVKELFGIHK